jgi:hypothetical protein
MEPLIQFFPSTIWEHLGTLLTQRIKALYMRMELADLLECHTFFMREVDAAAQHHPHSSTWCQFDGGCCLTDVNVKRIVAHPHMK